MKEYNICLCSDDNFVTYMEALIVSILRNSLDDEKFIFHIITLYISDDNKLRLDYLKNIKEFDIHYYEPVNIDKYNKWFQEKTDRKWSVEIFFKLDIPILLSHLDKVLFLDCDMIVINSLKELFKLDITDNLAAVVKDKEAQDTVIAHYTLLKPLYKNAYPQKNKPYYAFWKYFIETPYFKNNPSKYVDIIIEQGNQDIIKHNKLMDKISWWIPFKKMRNNFKLKYKKETNYFN